MLSKYFISTFSPASGPKHDTVVTFSDQYLYTGYCSKWKRFTVILIITEVWQKHTNCRQTDRQTDRQPNKGFKSLFGCLSVCLSVYNWCVIGLISRVDVTRYRLYGDDPSPRLGFLRGVFLANHLASNDNLTRTTNRQNT